MADRANRRNIIAAGIFAWSLATALAGKADSSRTCSWHAWASASARRPWGRSTSLLADYFDNARLPLAYGIVGAAPFIGTGLANIVGGPLIDWLEARPNFTLPLFGELYSWQMVLVCVGLPGILLAAVMFTIAEPVRRGALKDPAAGFPLREVWRFVASRASTSPTTSSPICACRSRASPSSPGSLSSSCASINGPRPKSASPTASSPWCGASSAACGAGFYAAG